MPRSLSGIITQGARAKREAGAETNRLILKAGSALGRGVGEAGRAGLFGDTPFTQRVFGPSNEKVAAKEEAKEEQQKHLSAAQLSAQADIPLELSLEFLSLDGPPSADLLNRMENARKDKKGKELQDIEDKARARAKVATESDIAREGRRKEARSAMRRGLAEDAFRRAVADPANDIAEGVDDQIIAQIESNLANKFDPLFGVAGVKQKITRDDIFDFMENLPQSERTFPRFMSLTKGTTAEGNKELFELFKSQTPRDVTAELAEDKFIAQKAAQATKLLKESANEEIRQAKETRRMQKQLADGVRQATLDAKNAGNEEAQAALQKAKAVADGAMEEMRQASRTWKAALIKLREIKRDVLNSTPEDIAAAQQEVTTALTELRIKETLVNQAKDGVVDASGNTITIKDIEVKDLPTDNPFLEAVKEALKKDK